MSGILRKMLLGAGIGLSLALVVGEGAGCATPPTGNSKGFGGVGNTTASEKKSHAINLSALTEFTDQAEDLITQEIYTVPALQSAKTRMVLYMGNFKNNTYSTSSSDFEMFVSRLRNKLAANPRIRERFIVQQDMQRMQALMNRDAPAAAPDLLQEGTSPAHQMNRYDPSICYVLNADFFEAVRDGKSQFYMVFNVDRLQTGESVITATRDLVQTR